MDIPFKKNLQKKDEIIAHLQLKEIKSLKLKNRKESSNFYTTLCENNKKEKFVLKIIITERPGWKDKFINEMQICQILSEIDQTLSPIHINSNDSNPPEWFLYKYQEGKIIGNWYKIENKFLTSALLDKIINKIESLQKTTKKIEKIIPTSKLNLSANFENKKYIVRDWARVFNNKIEKNLLDAKLDFYDKNIEKTLFVIAHNDLHPANILVNKKEIYFLDYFHTSFNNPLYDFIFFILCGWANKEILKQAGKKLKKIFPDIDKENSSSRISFELSAIEASLKLYINAGFHKSDIQETLKNNPELLNKELAEIEQAQQYFIEFFKNPNILFI